MTVRVTAWIRVAVPTIGPGPHPREATWADTLAALAAEHDARRVAERATRWPLRHRCTGRPDRDVARSNRGGSSFCCSALR